MITFFTGANDLTTYAPASNGTTITLAKPTAIADGDLLIAEIIFQNTNGTPAITPPAGWTRLGPAVGLSPLRPAGIYVLPVPNAAAVTDLDWTWSTNVSIGRRRGMLYRVTGADLSTPLDSSGVWGPTDGTTSLILPEVVATRTEAVLLAIGFTQSAAGLGYPNYTPPSPMVSIANVNTPPDAAANTGLWAGYEYVGVGPTGSRTIGINPASSNAGGYMVVLRSATGVVVPTVNHNIAGAVTSTSFQVAFRVSNVLTGVRIVASTASNLSNPVYSSAVVPDANGYGHATISGLNPNTVYHWALELDGTVSATFHGITRTYQRAGPRTSFSFAAASCINTGDNPAILDSLRARVGLDGLPARFFGHLGDFHYVYSSGGGNPIAPANVDILRGNFGTQMEISRQHQLFREIPLSYTWSDVDSFGSNCDGTYPAVGAANTAYRQAFPVPADMPATTGIYRTWVIGRIRFIQSDMRTFASDKAAPDNSSKTKLGSVQKAWFLNLIQNSTEKVIVWLGDSAWFGPVNSTGGNDSWGAYSNERAQLGNAISAAGINFMYIHGDIHALAADSGVNNQWGGFPFACAAPISRPDMSPWPSGATWTVSQGSYPLSSQAGTAYGWFDVQDRSKEIQIDYHGYNADIERVSMTVIWQIDGFQKGNGTALVPYVKISGQLVELE